MKKVLSLVLVVIMVICFYSSVFAAAPENEIISPLWNNIGSMSNVISFDGTAGTAGALVTGKTGTTKILGTLTVYKQINDGWQYVGQDTGESSTNYLTLEVEFTGASSAYYKSVLSVTVYINGVGESETKTAYKTCP